jgi:hypothetical protein
VLERSERKCSLHPTPDRLKQRATDAFGLATIKLFGEVLGNGLS